MGVTQNTRGSVNRSVRLFVLVCTAAILTIGSLATKADLSYPPLQPSTEVHVQTSDLLNQHRFSFPPNTIVPIEVMAKDTEITVSLQGHPDFPNQPTRNPIHGIPITHYFFAPADSAPLSIITQPERRTTDVTIRVGSALSASEQATGRTDENIVQARRADAIEYEAKIIYAAQGNQANKDVSERYLRAQHIWRELDNPQRLANAIVSRAFLAKSSADKQAALELFNQATSIESKLLPWVYLNLALYALDGQSEDKTHQFLKAGLAAAEQRQDKAALSALHSASGLLQHTFGRLDEAAKWYQSALRFAKEAGYRSQEAIIANNIAGIHYQRGEPQQAFSYFAKALAAHELNGDAPRAGEVRYNMASLHFRLGDMKQALPDLLAALKASRDHEPGSEQEAYTTAKIGRALFSLGNLPVASSYMNEALELHKKNESWNSYATSLLVLGDIDREQQRLEQALAKHTDAVRRFEEIGRTRGLTDAWIALTKDHMARGDLSKAQTAANTALEFALDSNDRLLMTSATLLSGQIATKLNQFKQAQSHLSRALTLVDDHSFRFEASQVLTTLGVLHLRQNEENLALEFARRAQQSVNDLRANIPPADLRARFFAEQLSPYDLEIDIHMGRYAKDTNIENAAAALKVAELASARSLNELRHFKQRSDSDAEKTGISKPTLGSQIETQSESYNPAQAVEQARQWADQTLPTETQHTQVTLQQIINARLLALRSTDQDDPEHQTLKRDLQALLLQGEGNNVFEMQAPLSIKDLQTRLTSSQQLVRFWWGQEFVYWWRLTDNKLYSGRIANPAELRSVVLCTHRAFRTIGGATCKNAELLDNLIDLAFEQNATLSYVVTDGPLSLLPIEAMLNDKQSMATVYLPSVSALTKHNNHQNFSEATALVVADPVFHRLDNRVPRKSGENNNQSPRTDTLLRPINLKRLPNTQKEYRSIASRLVDDRVALLSGHEATKKRVLTHPALKADILHFATHGLVDSELPEMSSLVFSTINEDEESLDAYLTLREVYTLPITAGLVVLSACDTQVGTTLRGEGVLGLSRGFLASGAENVISSLWAVSDKATAKFMEHFYDFLLGQELPPAQALAAAKNSMRIDPIYRDPYFYAGFVLLSQ